MKLAVCPFIFLMACTAMPGNVSDKSQERSTPIEEKFTPAQPMMKCKKRQSILSDHHIYGFEKLGWVPYQCSLDTITLRRNDTESLTAGAFYDPIEIGVSKFSSVSTYKKNRTALYYNINPDKHFEQIIRKKFKVSKFRNDLGFDGILDEQDHVFGSVGIAKSLTEMCEFTGPDKPNPQTICEKVIGIYLLRYSSHLIDYEKLQEEMAKISKVIQE